jgi:flagellar protein FlaG
MQALNPSHLFSAGVSLAQAVSSVKAAVSSGANAAPTTEPKPSEMPAADSVLVKKAAQQIEGFLAETSRKLSVTFDDASNRYITRVINRSTGEVIRTIPEEETIKVAQSIQGQMVNLRA